jgi:glycosyltransferase involved in cell wall biosynthesis
MRVTHITPLLFDDYGLVGGGERYPLELAKAMADIVPTRLVSFGKNARTFTDGQLTIEILPRRANLFGAELNPLSERLPLRLFQGDVIHAHQMESFVTNAALLARAVGGPPVFCTDCGGVAKNFNRYLKLFRYLDGFLPISEFSASFYPGLRDRTTVIYGGASASCVSSVPRERQRKAVFVGRLLPHKGIDILIEAMPDDLLLEVYGRNRDQSFFRRLEDLAVGKQVRFFPDADDDVIAEAYSTARVAVLPSVERSRDGVLLAARSELLGLVLLEAMACGTPIVVTATGALPEVVDDGVTGIVVPPNDPLKLREAILSIVDDEVRWPERSAAARASVEAKFTWTRVAELCLESYGTLRRPRRFRRR